MVLEIKVVFVIGFLDDIVEQIVEYCVWGSCMGGLGFEEFDYVFIGYFMFKFNESNFVVDEFLFKVLGIVEVVKWMFGLSEIF